MNGLDRTLVLLFLDLFSPPPVLHLRVHRNGKLDLNMPRKSETGKLSKIIKPNKDTLIAWNFKNLYWKVSSLSTVTSFFALMRLVMIRISFLCNLDCVTLCVTLTDTVRLFVMTYKLWLVRLGRLINLHFRPHLNLRRVSETNNYSSKARCWVRKTRSVSVFGKCWRVKSIKSIKWRSVITLRLVMITLFTKTYSSRRGMEAREWTFCVMKIFSNVLLAPGLRGVKERGAASCGFKCD